MTCRWCLPYAQCNYLEIGCNTKEDCVNGFECQMVSDLFQCVANTKITDNDIPHLWTMNMAMHAQFVATVLVQHIFNYVWLDVSSENFVLIFFYYPWFLNKKCFLCAYEFIILQDFNECSNPRMCGASSVCVNVVGSYR